MIRLKLVGKLSAGLVVLMLGVACGQGNSTEEPSATGAEEATGSEGTSAESIQFGNSLGQIRGHHQVALELYEAGDKEGAITHAGHPIHELLDSVSSELEEHDGPAEELSAGLDEVLAAIEEDAPAESVSEAIENVRGITFDAAESVDGETITTPAYIGSVIASLTSTAAHEYEEAVAGDGGGIRLLAEYQDGYAFVAEARSMYEDISGDVESASTEEAEEIEEAFEVLETAFPAAQPPNDLSDAEDVEAAASLIGHELEETVGASLQEESDPAEIAEEIESLLDEIVAAYEDGDAEGAAELSAEAYLENYEVIEAEVIEYAPEINEELEPLLGAELRRQIQEGAPVEDIEEMVARAKELLAEALEILEAEEE
jgi:hypothetical protein